MTVTPAQFVEFASDAAFSVNSDMKVTAWNGRAEELLGYSELEAIGMMCSKVLRATYPTGEPLCSALCEGRDCVKHSQNWGVESCYLRHKNGNLVPTAIGSMVFSSEMLEELNSETVAIFFLRERLKLESDEVTDSPLRVFTLGRFAVTSTKSGLDVDHWKRKQAAIILKILLSQLDKPVHREILIDWMWPSVDFATGWQRLKVNISVARNELRARGVSKDIIETVGQSYVVRSSMVWVDFDAFAKLVELGVELLKEDRIADALTQFQEADTHYRGDFFLDEPYAEWCAAERETLRELHLQMLAGLVDCYAQTGYYADAVRVCQKGLSTYPYRENFIQELMRNLIKLNRADWARGQYFAWRNTLETEFQLEPTSLTAEIFDELIGSKLSAAS